MIAVRDTSTVARIRIGEQKLRPEYNPMPKLRATCTTHDDGEHAAPLTLLGKAKGKGKEGVSSVRLDDQFPWEVPVPLAPSNTIAQLSDLRWWFAARSAGLQGTNTCDTGERLAQEYHRQESVHVLHSFPAQASGGRPFVISQRGRRLSLNSSRLQERTS